MDTLQLGFASLTKSVRWAVGCGEHNPNSVVAWKEGQPITLGAVQEEALRIAESEGISKIMTELPAIMSREQKFEEAKRRYTVSANEREQLMASIKTTTLYLIAGVGVLCGASVCWAARSSIRAIWLGHGGA